jgi:CHAD domain-containing protein
MDTNKSLYKHLKQLAKIVKRILVEHDESEKSIHALRMQTREILSLIGKTHPAYDPLKKIIKLSNTIRDIDVFFDFFIPSLPKKLKKQLLTYTKKNITCKRKKQFEKLYLYLILLEIPKDIQIIISQKNLDITKVELNFKKESLHKFRIYIKNLLYTHKNNSKENKQIIQTLSHVKDLLGNINDNFNAIKRLKQTDMPSKLFKKIDFFSTLENERYYQEVQALSKQIC